MTILTATQVAALVKQAGFPADVHVTMVAIAKAESGFNTEAKNPRSSAVGLFQILWSVHKRYDQARLKSDAAYNTKAAFEIYRSQGLNAWVAYSSGAYKKFVNEARQGVAAAANVTGNPVTATSTGNSTATSEPAVTYGPAGPQVTSAGVGVPLAAAEEQFEPLSTVRITGTQLTGDYARVVLGTPQFEAGIDMIPTLRFVLADPWGELLWQQANLFVKGARVQYRDLNMRINEIKFSGGSHGTGQIEIVAVDDIAFALMRLTGEATASGISAVSWLQRELSAVGIDPKLYLLGEAVATQSTINRDIPDQEGTTSSSDAASGWTTIVRLAKELGKRVFISGTRIVFGSSAFAMQWTAPGPLDLDNDPSVSRTLGTLQMPESSQVAVGNAANVVQVSFTVPLNRARHFRPGVPVEVKHMIGVPSGRYMVSRISHGLGIDPDGAEVTIVQPVDPPPEPPTAKSSTALNSGSTSGSGSSGGGVDGQVAQFVSYALGQAGKTYVFGAEAAPSNVNPRAFDCSELVEWAAARAGISPKVPDGSGAQLAHCQKNGTTISVASAIKTKGALLFMRGHVAISLGNGRTIEAMNPAAGVKSGNANGRGWTAGGKIPGAKGY